MAMIQQPEKRKRVGRGAIRSYMLQLYANPGKAEETCYALWWYRRLTLAYASDRLLKLQFVSFCDMIEACQRSNVPNAKGSYRNLPFINGGTFHQNCVPIVSVAPISKSFLVVNPQRQRSDIGLPSGDSTRITKPGGKPEIGNWEESRTIEEDKIQSGSSKKISTNAKGRENFGGMLSASTADDVHAAVRKFSLFLPSTMYMATGKKNVLNTGAAHPHSCANCTRSQYPLTIRCSAGIATAHDTTTQASAPTNNNKTFIRESWPARSSITCPKCWYSDKANRRGVEFCCRRCGHVAHADSVAGINLARRARGVWHPEIPDKKAALQAQSEGAHKTA